MSENNIIKILQGISFLHDIAPDHLQQIASIAELRVYDANDNLFYEGQPAEHVFLIVSGRIVLELCPATIYQKNLMSVGPGEMLGWSSFVEQRNYASTGVVVAPTQLVKINGKQLRAICDRDPVFGYDFMHRIMRAVAKRLTATWSQLATIYVHNTLPMHAAGVGE
jgi:CRP/FNR family transcriptional regulator, cyclic AMP receptor protein